MSAPVKLEPAMPLSGVPETRHARWIGSVDLAQFSSVPAGSALTVTALKSDGFTRARMLLRRGLEPLGFVDTDIVDGDITLPPTDAVSVPSVFLSTPPVSIVLCTRDRPDDLAGALQSIIALDYPEFEVVVVDNAATTDATARVVSELGDDRVRHIAEPVAGLSNARNAGLRAARHEIVAFTDDDVVVDAQWLRGLALGFSRGGDDVACVCGMVPSGELRTAAQAYFDQRVSWAQTLTTRRYSLAAPPEDMPLFPFQVGRYGTGANFAVRRRRVIELGGFDEALGAGTLAKGGEDIDMFFRLIVAGHTLVNEPAAIVWHRHRTDGVALMTQARGYGVGLGAFLTKIGIDRSHRRLALSVACKRFRSAMRASADYGAIMKPAIDFEGAVPRSVGRTEVLSVLGGPWALWRGRRQGRRRLPLQASR